MSRRTHPGQRLQELQRELATRQRVYPGWILKHRADPKTGISAENAAHRIAVIEDLIEDLYQLYPTLRPAATAALFPPTEDLKISRSHSDTP